MQSEHKEKQVTGRITSGLVEQDNLALKTIEFVREQLPAWRDDPHRPLEDSERKLNSQLCDFLASRASNVFPMVRFKHEELQSGRSSVDLSAKPVESMVIEARRYTIYDPILVLECKRLPAPSQDREKEYVTGGKDYRSGGMQRFKLGIHGADLNLVVMIGYVQERSMRDWHREINGWISELCSGAIADICVWKKSETLEPLEEDISKGVSRCRSFHYRIGSKLGNKIEIHHFWIVMAMLKNAKVHNRC